MKNLAVALLGTVLSGRDGRRGMSPFGGAGGYTAAGERFSARASMHAAFSALFRGNPDPRARHSPALPQRYCPCIARKHDQHRLAFPSRSAPEAPDTRTQRRAGREKIWLDLAAGLDISADFRYNNFCYLAYG